MAKTIGQLTQATTIGGADELVIEQSGLTKRVAASVVRGGLVNADIDAAAAIAGSKLADDAITTAKIDDDAVTTAKILDANVTPAKLLQPLTLATAQNTTSGTSIDFTGIPSWAKRITVMFVTVSTSGTSSVRIRLGTSGGLETSGYVGSSSAVASTVATINFSSGFDLADAASAANQRSGLVTFALVNANTWAASGCLSLSDASRTLLISGAKALSATLDRIRLTTVDGTDTFDAGSVNIMYEG